MSAFQIRVALRGGVSELIVHYDDAGDFRQEGHDDNTDLLLFVVCRHDDEHPAFPGRVVLRCLMIHRMLRNIA